MAIVSADSLQLSMVPELVPGTTPATPAFMLIRTSGESLTFNPVTSESTELAAGGRTAQPSNVTGMTIAGDINFEFHDAPWMQEAFAGLCGSQWGQCPLTGTTGGAIDDTDRVVPGETLRTYTIEKRFPDPDNIGQFLYQWYVGVTFNTFTLNVTPGTPVTGSFGITGGVPTLGTTAITGATYAGAGNSSVFTAPEVTELTVGNELDVNTNCWNSCTININSNNSGIQCIGTQGDRESVLGTMTAELSGEVYYRDQDILTALLNNTTVGDSVIILQNAEADTYRFDFFGCKCISGSLNAESTGAQMTMPLGFSPTPVTICENLGESWNSSILISKKADAPTLP